MRDFDTWQDFFAHSVKLQVGGNLTFRNAHDAMYRAAIDVMQSEFPLDGEARHYLARIFEDQWHAFSDPKFDQQRKRKFFANAVVGAKREALARGGSVEALEQNLADILHMEVDAIRKRIMRARK